MARWRIAVLLPALAQAQYAPPPGQMGEQPKETPQGPAEQEEQGEEKPELPPLRLWPGQEDRRLQFLATHGYYRFRIDRFYKLNLGLEPTAQPPQCAAMNREAIGGGCPPNTMSGANMRLRVEPTLSAAEQVRVKTQFDILDNLQAGSTPDGFGYGVAGRGYTPTLLFSDGQVPPESGRNSTRAGVRVKRVWAEVDTPLGRLQFGRMPWHWGMGMVSNDGNCLDCDYGDTVDRLLFSVEPSENTLLMVATDWASSGYTSDNFGTAALARYNGQGVDLENLDDVHQWVFVFGKIQQPDEYRDRLARGESVFNAGLQLVYRSQDFDYTTTPATPDLSTPGEFVRRDAWMLNPDVWLKFLFRKLEVEFEGAFIGGRIGGPAASDPARLAADEIGSASSYDIVEWGFTSRTTFHALKDSLRVGMESGAASGDSAEMKFLNSTHDPVNLQPRGDDTLNQFRFDPDYIVDLILFREILGSVTNALYFKPFLNYDFVEAFGMTLGLVPSWALTPVATPGNASFYGLELDLGLHYRNVEEGFFAGLQYGVFFAGAALERPHDLWGQYPVEQPDGSTLKTDLSGDAGVAQTLQGYFLVKF
jgi:uncharacterized protein (TIGR04551 family)